MTETEIEVGTQKLTKTERILYTLLLFGLIFYSGYLIFSYIQPDAEYLEFARSEGWQLAGFLGLVIGALLVSALSGRKEVKNSKNKRLFISLFILPTILVIIILFWLMISFATLKTSHADPREYFSLFLLFSGVTFVYSALISFIRLYIDEIAKKLKKQKFDNIESVRKQTKLERNTIICWFFCAVVLYGIFLLCYPLPDWEYLEFARDLGWKAPGYLGLVIGALLVSVISGKKRVKKAENLGLLIFFAFVVGIVYFVVLITFADYFFIHRGFFEPTDPNDYLRIILSFSGAMFIAGILTGLVSIYIDDFAEKYLKKGMKF